MVFFSSRVNSDEYEKLLKRIAEIANDISQLNSKVAALITNQNSLRGLVNRKIGEEVEKDSYDNSGVILKDGAI